MKMNTNNTHNGSGDKILDWAVIIIAMILFAKTADVMAYFAPESLSFIVGMDISWLYGAVNALIVEGVALALHFNRRAALSGTAQIVKWALIAMSGSAQIFDGFLSTGAQSSMSEPLKFGLQFGVPLIPLIVLVLLFAIGRLPDDGIEKAPFVGLKNMVGPAVRRLWHGEQGASAEVSLTSPDTNGQKPKLKVKKVR
jgi:hypothetical protein